MKKYLSLLIIFLNAVHCDAQSLPDSLTKKIDNLFAKWNTPASPGCVIGVIRNDSIIYAKGFGMADLEHAIPITPSTIFYMCSVSKQFTGYSIVLLARQGKIKLDEDVQAYLPWVPDFGKKISVRNLLNHTSGLRDDISLSEISGLGMDGMLTQDLAINIIKRQRKLNFNPGEQYAYSNSNYVLLAEIVKAASGQSFRAFADSAIFKPLGMTHSYFQDDYSELIKDRAFSYGAVDSSHFNNNYQNVYTLGDGGLFTNLTDMAKWASNFTNPKAGDKKDITQLTEKGKLKNGEQINYALGISVGEYKGWREFAHSGGLAGYRTFVSILPDLKMGFLVFSNVGNFNSTAKLHQVADLFIAGNKTKEKVVPDNLMPFLKDTVMLKKLEADYISDNGFRFKFRVSSGKAYIDRDGQSNLLQQNDKDTFSVTDNPKVKFYFGKSKDKKTDGLFTPSGQLPQPFKKYDSNIKQTDEILKKYAGTYYSQELDCSYNIIVKKHQLFLTSNKYNDAEIVLGGEDNLIDKSGVLSHLKIIRDNKNKIKGFEVNSGRVMHLVFDKIK